MDTTITQTVGIDISKDTLDVHLHPENLARQFTNNSKGFTALINWLAEQHKAQRLIFEPTGAYHHAFERRLGQTGLPMIKVNPLQARRFAEAIGSRAKTDAVDAAMLARFGALGELQARPPVSQSLDDLKELLVARRALIKDRTAATNRDHVSRAPLLKRLATQRLRQIERQLEAIDAAMQSLCQADTDLKVRLAILVSIPGIGEPTALAMLIEMPELGTIENKCVASLAGLAPIARDSGQTRGKRFIRGGRAQLRQALYMPALVAVRFNADMKQKIPSLRRSRQTQKNRHRRRDAKARRARQRVAQRSAPLGPKQRLIKTDTLAEQDGLYQRSIILTLGASATRSECDS